MKIGLGSIVSDKNHPDEKYLIIYDHGDYKYLDLLRFSVMDGRYESIESMDDGDVLVKEKITIKS